MNLKKLRQAGETSYVCPMHPKATSDKPGRCPDCGMHLKRVQVGGKGKDS